MAKDTKRTERTQQVPLTGVMLHARAIIEQGRTEEFLDACSKHGFTMRATSAFMKFAHDFASEGSAATDAELASARRTSESRFTTAIRGKNWNDCT